ncbi:MAG: hypothetical protein UY23_C0001G0175 [Candidatus Jorgensenbacteria bacterium GW2011_GWA1_48_11]|uniref:Uncharacterized protein n=1 Tax=Candidatus Jorgensenbacteria bacterium GW2011_GWA1_48_11 TaxID=1618660 RepID=A0A0G1UBR6_9BACT|nr:MAG: hypothetical protein UY23_C0001G0175 [Candidatus Jorgensenbacteria bacterium GW2011_GWA1_48_11]KKW12062.1 MAG: hypothetical protein UY51_C0005G0304 [Candidatus Jorgensenbacteria bacterium GW2011_GWB1_49_9]
MVSVTVRLRPGAENRKNPVISLGKAVAKKAVTRNRIKRRIRAIAKPFVKNQTKEVFIIVRPEAAGQSYQSLKQELEKAFKKQ